LELDFHAPPVLRYDSNSPETIHPGLSRQRKKASLVSSFLTNNGHRWRLCFGVLQFVCFVLAGTMKSWGQDLGALAREEQARKATQQAHPVHVYTNEDLSRPLILFPEYSVNLEATRRQLPPSLMPLPPASEPEPEAQEVSLGEIARKYREEKLARESWPLQRPALLARVPHIYTNDDMERPKILTPEDDARYLAALKKPFPAEMIAIAPPAPSGNESVKPEPAHMEATGSETPLGDIARAAYQQLHPPEPVLSARGRARSRNEWGRKLVAYRTSRPGHSPQRIISNADAPDPRPAKVQSEAPAIRSDEAFTVRAGDSLWKLARVHLGSGLRWRELLKANPWIKNPNRLKIGTKIRS